MYAHKDSRRPTPGGEVQAVLLRILSTAPPPSARTATPSRAWPSRSAAGWASESGELQALRRAAELHDVGKIAIPDAILDKPGPLNDEEWEFMRQHTVLGERILVGRRLAGARSAASSAPPTSAGTAAAIPTASRASRSRSPPASSSPATPTTR